ncbi:uncharacterized protein LOC110468659 [Lonchura striata]
MDWLLGHGCASSDFHQPGFELTAAKSQACLGWSSGSVQRLGNFPLNKEHSAVPVPGFNTVKSKLQIFRFSMMEDNTGSITAAATQPTPACFQAKVTISPIICAAPKEDQKHKNRTRDLHGDEMRKQPTHPQTQPSLTEGCGPGQDATRLTFLNRWLKNKPGLQALVLSFTVWTLGCF